MDFNRAILPYAAQPLTHQLVLSLLTEYKQPNDKIHQLINQGVLAPVKKGLYVAGASVNAVKPEPFLLANHILGPSYVSLDTALSYHGFIPERVYTTTSITTKPSRSLDTVAGLFTYTHLPLPYYSFGIQQVRLSDDQYAMVASAEKALCDKIITTTGIVLRSEKSAASYLLDDLRMDEDNLKQLNTHTMLTWLPDAPKRDSLLMAIKMIDKLW